MKNIMQNYQLIRVGRILPLFLIVLLFNFTLGHAQQVEGVVIDGLTGDPLPGVNVVVKGTTIGVSTDTEGQYQLEPRSLQDTLVYSFIGYQTQEILINGRTQINIELQPQALTGENVVIVGYGTQRREKVSGSVGQISAENVDNFSTSNTQQLLQGKVAGVTVTSGGGAPDADATVTIRGVGTFGNDQPLYVIDGMQTNSMDFVNPKDIESIEVLKDAASAAIYGNNSANGVIVVTTKSGRPSDDLDINIRSSVGFQNPTNKLDFVNAQQWVDLQSEARTNDGLGLAPGLTMDPTVNTDFQDENTVNLKRATVVRNSGSIGGGFDKGSFFVSGEHINQLGLVEEADFKRVGFRVNSDWNFGKLRVTESISFSREVSRPNVFFGRERGAIPAIPVRDEDNLGGFAGIEPQFWGVARGINWLGVAKLNQRRINTDRLLGNFTINYEIFEGLDIKLNLGLDYGLTDDVNFLPAFFQSRSQEAFNDVADLTEGTDRKFETLIENTINYKTDIRNHHIDVLAGYTEESNDLRTASIQVTGFPSNAVNTINAATELSSANGGQFKDFRRSGFGRVNYDFKDKYIISGTIRVDVSSKFAPGNRLGKFPGISGAWRISEESFFPEFFDEFKFRGSWGRMGSQNIGPFATVTGLNVNSDFFFAGGVQTGTALTELSNPNIQWEVTETAEGGIDISFLDNRVDMNMSFFNKRSSGILAETPIPVLGGVGSTVLRNSSTVRNYGLEFGGTYNHDSSNDFDFSVSANLSVLRNNVAALGEGVNPISGGSFTQQGFNASRTQPGQPIASFFGWKVEGILQNEAEVEASGQSGARPGDFNYEDVNGDGIINEDDRVFLGDPHPKHQYGINFNGSYKNFDIGIFIQGMQGQEAWNSKRFQTILDFAGGNKITKALNAWTPDNRDTNIPRASFQDPNNNKRESDFFVEDASFVRLKNFQLGYIIPSSITNTFGANFDQIRVYFSGSNLITITDYSGYDPEIGRNSGFRNTGIFGQGVDTNAQPTPRTFTFGVDVSF